MSHSQAQRVRDGALTADPPNRAVRTARSAEVGTADVSRLSNLKTKELRQLWRRLYRSDPPERVRRDLLVLAIGWKEQARAGTGPGAVMRRRLAALAKTLDEGGDLVQPRTVRPKPGATLMREWHGESHTVSVTEQGFEWRGKQYGSLSEIARAITGTRWSGPRFFGLRATTNNTSKQERLDG